VDAHYPGRSATLQLDPDFSLKGMSILSESCSSHYMDKVSGRYNATKALQVCGLAAGPVLISVIVIQAMSIFGRKILGTAISKDSTRKVRGRLVAEAGR
jgi:hypothetical protein